MVKTRSIYLTWLESVPGRDRQTDGLTDRIRIANTRSQQYLPVQLSRVKNGSQNNYRENKLTEVGDTDMSVFPIFFGRHSVIFGICITTDVCIPTHA